MSVEPLLVSGFESRSFLQPQLVNAVVQIAALIDANDFFRCNGRHLTLRGRVVFGLVDERVVGLFSSPLFIDVCWPLPGPRRLSPSSWVCGGVPQSANCAPLRREVAPQNSRVPPRIGLPGSCPEHTREFLKRNNPQEAGPN